VDADTATLTVELHGNKVNHLICLGQGELAERAIIHLYADRFGQFIDRPYYSGIDERCEVYENTSVPTLEELRENGVKRFKELREVDKADISKINDAFAYDIGDIVGALDVDSGITVTAAVTQKIVRINNGAVSTEYKTEG
jgi:tetrahydromethanopterin S-methyltransferase subunit A